VEQTRLRRNDDPLPDLSKMPSNVQAMLQGPMLLAAALPHHGPGPKQQELDQMSEAGQLLYKAYTMLQNADDSLGASAESLKLMQTSQMQAASTVTSGIADSERMINAAKDILKKGQDLQRTAKATFFNNANPLGDPPEAPHDWDNVAAMGMRASSKMTQVSESLLETKKQAREQGVSLSDITVGKESAVLLQDAYGKGKDDEILSFLNGY